jgi:SPP1 family predicted phage head-tail adaptor
MRAGELTTRFRIEEPVNNELDAAGHPVEKWKLFQKVWGEITDLAAGESDGRDQKDASASVTVKIRYTKGVHTGMRLRFEDDKVQRMLGIEGITKDRRNIEMTLACREDRSART